MQHRSNLGETELTQFTEEPCLNGDELLEK